MTLYYMAMKTDYIRILFTPQEKEQIRSKANARGQTITTFVKRAIEKGEPTIKFL